MALKLECKNRDQKRRGMDMQASNHSTDSRLFSFRSVAHFVFVLLGIVLVMTAQRARAADQEFEGYCVMGLAEGKRIRTECKVTWKNDNGKTYCFASEDSKSVFLKNPTRNIQLANDHFALGAVESTADDMGRYTAGDVTTFINQYIKAKIAKNDGVFPIEDTLYGKTLALVFDKVEFVRTLHGYGFFPNTYFHSRDNEKKKYQVDFWVRPKGGKLSVVDERIYKAPRKEGDGYILMTRFPKPWWWIPASEHPGEGEEKRGWEIMSAIHDHIVASKNDDGSFKLKDDKTGKVVDLEFIGIHQPVRKLKEDGRFFACSDFRKKGSKNEIYDIDFWLDEKSGKIKVGEVRVHKVPELRDGNYVQIPRYSFESKNFDLVP